MIKKFAFNMLAGTTAYFIFGWFVFDVILGNYTDLNTTHLPGFKKTEEEFSLVALILSCGAYSALMTYILVYLLDIKQLLRSFWIASIIGMLVAIMTDTYWLASSHFYLNHTVMFLDILAAGITVGFLGIVIVFVNKKFL